MLQKPWERVVPASSTVSQLHARRKHTSDSLADIEHSAAYGAIRQPREHSTGGCFELFGVVTSPFGSSRDRRRASPERGRSKRPELEMSSHSTDRESRWKEQPCRVAAIRLFPPFRQQQVTHSPVDPNPMHRQLGCVRTRARTRHVSDAALARRVRSVAFHAFGHSVPPPRGRHHRRRRGSTLPMRVHDLPALDTRPCSLLWRVIPGARGGAGDPPA